MNVSTHATGSKSEHTRPSESLTHSDQGQRHSAPRQTRIVREGETPLFEKLYRGITSPMRLLPDFLIIGTQRGGTTSLYNYLQAHPCIGPSSTKEIHFFDRQRQKGLRWYRGHFPTRVEQYYAHRYRKRAFVTGEASPSYLFYPHTAGRVAEVLPQVKLIVLLRNPVDRAYSQYFHAVEHGFETLSFEAAIDGEIERTAAERDKIVQDEFYQSHAFRHRSYLSRGIYVEQLQAWMELFPREQFLILKSEEFYTDPAATFKRVLAFLGIREMELEPEQQDFKLYNNNIYSSRMDAALRKRLIEYFEPHNARLYDLLGIDFGWDK